jgi:hypothetical protein
MFGKVVLVVAYVLALFIGLMVYFGMQSKVKKD